MKGQTRGNSKSWFGGIFGHDKTDASGQVDTTKPVGYFKGNISVSNDSARLQYKKEADAGFKKICDLLNRVYQNKYGESLDFDATKILQPEHQAVFRGILANLGLDIPGVFSFFLDTASEMLV